MSRPVRRSALLRTALLVAVVGGLPLPDASAAAGPIVQQVKLTASDATAWAEYGGSVDISGDTVVVGAVGSGDAGAWSGAAYVYQREASGAYGETRLTATDADSEDRFGSAVAVAGDTVVVSAPDDDEARFNAGAVYVYDPDGNGGFSETKLMASNASSDDTFGYSVAASGDRIVVGGYPFPDDPPVRPFQPIAYLYERNAAGGFDETELPLTGADPNYFPFTSVAVSGDVIAVAAWPTPNLGVPTPPGVIYVYTPDGGGGLEERTIVPSQGDGSDWLGSSISVFGDTIAIGAYGDDDAASDGGAVYVFEPDGAGGYVETKLTAFDAAPGDWFGWDVSISEQAIVVGAPGDDGPGTYSGSVYRLTPDGAGGYDQDKLTTADAGAEDFFGTAVGASGDTVVVGAELDDDGGFRSGSAYLFATATVPFAPSAVVASAVDGQATVSWTPPVSNGGSIVTGYRVTAYVGYYPVKLVTFASTATTQTITGLLNGTTYRFRVRAVNAVGSSPFSGASNPVVPAVPVVPGAPSGASAVAGYGSAMVSWAAPAQDGGAPVTGYIVTPYVGYWSGTPRVFSSPATSQALSGLTNGWKYRFRVQAVNAVGAGPPSTATNPVIPAP